MWSSSSVSSSPQKSSVREDDAMGIDWVSDKAVKDCVMCNKKFNALRRRRHHCRQCGRVVCWACSSKRLVLEGERYGNKAQRVCDGCHLSLTHKAEVREFETTVRAKEEALLSDTSYISESLLKVYMLDGTSSTISYDDCTTVAEAAEKICFTVKMALFEVAMDMRDSDQYTLLKGSDRLSDLVVRWSINGKKTAKLVLPIYSLASVLGAKVPSYMAGFSFTDAQPNQRGGSSKLASAHMSPQQKRSQKVRYVFGQEEDDHAAASYGSFVNATGIAGIAGIAGVTVNAGNSGNAGLAAVATTPTERRFMEKHLSSPQQDSAHSLSNIPSPLKMGLLDTTNDDSLDASGLLTMNESTMQDEVQSLRAELDALHTKYDLLRNIHSRQMLRSQSQQQLTPPKAPSTPQSRRYRGESYDLFDEKRCQKKAQLQAPAVDDESTERSSLYGGYGLDDRSSLLGGVEDALEGLSVGQAGTAVLDCRPTRTYADGGDSSGVDSAESDYSDSNQNEKGGRTSRTSWLSFRSSTRNSMQWYSSKDKDKAGSEKTGDRDSTATSMSRSKKRHSNSMKNRPSPAEDSAGHTPTTQIQAVDWHGAGPQLMLLSPKDVSSIVSNIDYDSQSSDFQQFVRTFFHQTVSVENFLLKFQMAVKTLMEREFAATVSESKSGGSAQIGSSDAPSAGGAVLEHILEMAVALEALYGFVMAVSEEWAGEVRCWSLALLKENLTVPLKKTERLQVVIRHLRHAELLYAPLAISYVQRYVDSLFDPNNAALSKAIQESDYDYDSAKNSNGSIESDRISRQMKRARYALDVLTDDLLPVFPDDFPLLSMYQTHLDRLVNEDLGPYFHAHKGRMSPPDTLDLLSFAESQGAVLGRFNGDIDVVSSLAGDAMQHLCTTTETGLKQALGRAHLADERAIAQRQVFESHASLPTYSDETPESYNSSGLVTPWPQELLALYSEQLTMAANSLQPESRDFLWGLVLDTLPDFVSRQKSWLSKSADKGSLSMERLCAHINNHVGFAKALENRLERLTTNLDDTAMDRIAPQFQTIAGMFTSHADYTLHILIKHVKAEVRGGLYAGMFKPGWEGSGSKNGDKNQMTACTQKTQALLGKFADSLFAWLLEPHYANAALGSAALCVCETHVELILLSQFLVTAPALARLEGDLKHWSRYLQEFTGELSEPMEIDKALSVWSHVIQALSLDTRQIAMFVRDQLYPDFGPSTIKVWSTIMQLRGETKPVTDALFEAIMRDWSPPPVKPNNPCEFQSKLKTPKFTFLEAKFSIFK